MANVQAQLQQAVAMHRAGRLPEAEALYRAVLSRQPKNADVLSMLGLVAAGQGRMTDGIDLLRRADRARPGDPAIQYNLANLLRATGRLDEAAPCYRRSLERRPGYAEAWYGLACTLEQMRDREGALEAAARAVELAPGHIMAAVVLARLDRLDGNPAAARDRLQSLAARADLPPMERTQVMIEFGRTLDRLGAYDDAFAAFQAGQEAFRATPDFERTRPEAFAAMVEACPAVITPARLREWGEARWDDGLPDPVYLIGFPRSGTTMIEQMLGAHSACVTTDERPFTQNLVRALPRLVGFDYPAALDMLSDEHVSALRRQYWDEAIAFVGRDPAGFTFVDKQPMNLAYVGLLARLFPGARLIVVVRDPRDVCLSCFMQAFTANQAMSNFTTLESTVRLYDRLMSFWAGIADTVPLRVHTVRYDDAVSDLEATARGLLEFLGLPWEDTVLRFNEQVGERYIQTPSYEAVAQAVYTRSLGRWRNYAAPLAPFRETLDRHAAALGYSTD